MLVWFAYNRQSLFMVEVVQHFLKILLFCYKKIKNVIDINIKVSVFAWRGNAY